MLKNMSTHSFVKKEPQDNLWNTTKAADKAQVEIMEEPGDQ